MSRNESLERCQAYESLGYQVVWILHDYRYNRRRLSAMEETLRKRGCYFTNINANGNGIIYDQFEVLRGSKRIFKGPKLPVHLTNPFDFSSIDDKSPIKEKFKKRLTTHPVFFEGDIIFRMLKTPRENLPEAVLLKFPGAVLVKIWLLLKRFYLSIFRMLIEKVSSHS
jgi:competence protein CoiA